MLADPVFAEAEFEELFDALSAPIGPEALAAGGTTTDTASDQDVLLTEVTAAAEQHHAQDSPAVSYSLESDESAAGVAIEYRDVEPEAEDLLASFGRVPAAAPAEPSGSTFDRMTGSAVPRETAQPDIAASQDAAELHLPDFLAAFDAVPVAAPIEPTGSTLERTPVPPVASESSRAAADQDLAELHAPDFLAAFEDAPAAAPIEPPGSTFESMPVSPAPPDTARAGISTREIATGLLGIAAGGVLIFALLSAGGSASPEATAAAAAPKAAPPPATEPTIAPKWTSNRAAWVGAERNAVAFELAATNKVGVWMRQVHPRLVVRCRASRVEVFVFTDSPAKMEPQDGDHTVEVQFDESAAATQRWPDSAEHDALFAPDGAAFLEQLVRAQRLRFGFSPHNSSPVVINFEVAGLQSHLAGAARPCGWNKR